MWLLSGKPSPGSETIVLSEKTPYSSQICSTSCDRWYAEPFWGWLKSETQKQEWNHISQRSSYHWPLHFKEPTRVSRYHYLLADYQFSVASHKTVDQSITNTCLIIELFLFLLPFDSVHSISQFTTRRAEHHIIYPYRTTWRRGPGPAWQSWVAPLQCLRKWNLVLRTWGQKLFNGEKKDFWVKGP